MASYTWYASAVALLAAAVFASALPPAHAPKTSRQDAGTPTVEVQQLVAGLGFNIMTQKGEVAVASMMQSLLQAPTPNPELFQAAKDDLMSFMSAGMRIRSNNLVLSKVNPQITRGLAQVSFTLPSWLESTQILQMALANNLTGTAGNDGPVLEKLQNQFQAAIQKNEGLQSLATGGPAMPMMTKAASP